MSTAPILPVTVETVNAALPQTQCTQCGYDGCRPYAQALVAGQAAINRCPPGGPQGVERLATLLNRPVLPLDTTRGHYGPLQVAVIDEEHCIGCTLCIQACPVDAIVGANLRMHTVVAADCTGCQLCVAPCPVDCIAMVTVQPETWWQPEDAARARDRFEQRQARLAWLETQAHRQRPGATNASVTEPATAAPAAHDTATADAAKQAAIAAALARARARRTPRP